MTEATKLGTAAVALFTFAALSALLGWSHTKARNGGRLEACAYVCGGDAEWATVGEGCVCLVREEVAGGAQ